MKRHVILLLSIYALCIVLVSLLWSRPVVLSVCLAVISVFLLGRWHSKGDVLFYAVAFVLGPVGEAIAIRSGAWAYSKPMWLIPLWLPIVWGVVALFLKNLVQSRLPTE